MSAQQEDKLLKFVRRTVSPSAGNTRISLSQLAASGGVNLVRNFDFQPGGMGEDEITNLAAELLVAAQEDADQHQSVSKYCFRACKGVSQGERQIITLRSQLQDEENLGSTELPNTAGLTAQLMRHNEALFRHSMQKDEIHARQYTEVLSRLTERLTHYEDKHYETLELLEGMLSEKDDREVRRLESAAKSKRLDEALKAFKPMVPVLMAKFKGTPPDAKPGLMMESLKSILTDITPEKMKAIVDILGPQSLALAEIYIAAHEKDAEEHLEEKH